MLVLTAYIAKHEYKPLAGFLTIKDIIDGAQKVAKGLGVETKSPRHLTGYRFFKVRVGARNGARMIVFVVTGSNKIVPVLIRLKKDKLFGMNMALNNPRVVAQMNKNLDNILDDIQNNNYQVFRFLS